MGDHIENDEVVEVKETLCGADHIFSPSPKVAKAIEVSDPYMLYMLYVFRDFKSFAMLQIYVRDNPLPRKLEQQLRPGVNSNEPPEMPGLQPLQDVRMYLVSPTSPTYQALKNWPIDKLKRGKFQRTNSALEVQLIQWIKIKCIGNGFLKIFYDPAVYLRTRRSGEC